jgi:deoxyribodipyrimidine photolyase-like uncharacterized protein
MGTVVIDNALAGLFKEFQMSADFSVLPFDFNSTTVTVVANNAAAQARIYGGVSVEVFKSAAQQFVDQLEADGFQVSLS